MSSTSELQGFTKVKLKNDDNIYNIYDIYNEHEFSLCLLDYDDVEQDTLVNISEVEEVQK